MDALLSTKTLVSGNRTYSIASVLIISRYALKHRNGLAGFRQWGMAQT